MSYCQGCADRERELEAKDARIAQLEAALRWFLGQHAQAAKLRFGEKATCACPVCPEARALLTPR